MRMSLKEELLVEYLLWWVIIGVNVNARSASYWGLRQVPLGDVLETNASSSNQTGL